MAIKYCIQSRTFQGQDMFVGRVNLKGSYTREMLIKRILEMGSTITEADIIAVVKNFEKAVQNICLEGNKITMDGFMQFTPAVSGKFTGEMDGFDPVRHRAYITAQISAPYNTDFENQVTMEKEPAVERKPNLIAVYDVDSKTSNKSITRNHIVSIGGDNLKLDFEAPDEYLKFVNGDNVTESTPITKFQKLTAKEIVFLMPAVTYTKGYFEVGTKLGTLTLKTGKSTDLSVI